MSDHSKSIHKKDFKTAEERIKDHLEIRAKIMREAQEQKIQAENNFRRVFYGQIFSNDGQKYNPTFQYHDIEDSIALGNDYFSYAMFAFYLLNQEERDMMKSNHSAHMIEDQTSAAASTRYAQSRYGNTRIQHRDSNEG